MLREPIATFRKSELRKPEVVERALEGPVEIVVSASESLLVLRAEIIEQAEREQGDREADHEQLRRLMQIHLAMEAALARAEVSPLLLGDVGFIADWSPEDRTRFAKGFGEALAESLRTNDPAPALGYIQIMGTRRRSIERPSAPWDADEHEALLPERVRTGSPTS